jgi:hypothetical protein
MCPAHRFANRCSERSSDAFRITLLGRVLQATETKRAHRWFGLDRRPPRLLLSVRGLSRLFRRLFLQALEHAFKQNTLRLHGELQDGPLRQKPASRNCSRNRFGAIMAHIVVRGGDNIVGSVITRNSTEELGLKNGDHVKWS